MQVSLVLLICLLLQRFVNKSKYLYSLFRNRDSFFVALFCELYRNLIIFKFTERAKILKTREDSRIFSVKTQFRGCYFPGINRGPRN